LPFAICHLPFAILHMLCRLPFVICCAVCHLSYAVCCLPFAVRVRVREKGQEGRRGGLVGSCLLSLFLLFCVDIICRCSLDCWFGSVGAM
jgi:hypothetical protein